MSGLLTVFAKELRDGLRERRAVATALLFGPLLGPVLFGAMIGYTINQQIDDAERPISVPVIGGERAPHLMAHLGQNMVDADTDAFAADSFAARRDALRAAVRGGDVDVGVVIAPDFAAALASGEAARVWIVSDRARSSSRPAVARVRGALSSWSSTVGSIRLQLRGLSPVLHRPLALLDDDVSTPSGRAILLLGMVTYFLLFATLIGGSQVAVDSTAGERERGSLEPLLTMPVSREVLVLGKTLTTVVFMAVSLAIAIVSFHLAVRLLPLAEIGMTAHFDLVVCLKLFALTLPFAVLAAGLMVAAAAFTRSLREAQTYTSLAMLVPTLPIVAAVIRPVQPDVPLMLIPSLSQHLLITATIKAEALDPLHVAVSALSTLAVGAVLIYVTMRRFRSEKLIL